MTPLQQSVLTSEAHDWAVLYKPERGADVLGLLPV